MSKYLLIIFTLLISLFYFTSCSDDSSPENSIYNPEHYFFVTNTSNKTIHLEIKTMDNEYNEQSIYLDTLPEGTSSDTLTISSNIKYCYYAFVDVSVGIFTAFNWTRPPYESFSNSDSLYRESTVDYIEKRNSFEIEDQYFNYIE